MFYDSYPVRKLLCCYICVDQKCPILIGIGFAETKIHTQNVIRKPLCKINW